MNLQGANCVTAHIAIGLLAVGIVGCGGGGPDRPDKVPVSGKVTLDDKPATGAVVQFVSAIGGAAEATVDEQGNYSVEGGVEVGMQKVAIMPPPAPMGGAPADPANPTEKSAPPSINVPAKYHTPATSGFEAKVEAKEGDEPNTFNFEMKSGG